MKFCVLTLITIGLIQLSYSQTTTRPPTTTPRPTTRLSSTTPRPTTRLSSTTPRPTTRLSSTTPRPTTRLSSTTPRPVSTTQRPLSTTPRPPTNFNSTVPWDQYSNTTGLYPDRERVVCIQPKNLLETFEVPLNGVYNYRKLDELNATESIYGPSCSSSYFRSPDLMYGFRLTTEMYFDISMVGLNISMDTVLALINFNCTNELYCSDDYINITSRIFGYLKPGEYKLVATVFDRSSIGKFELTVSFSLKDTKPVLGSCLNPYYVGTSPVFGIKGQVYGGLHQDGEQIKLPCAEQSTKSYIYSFKIPNNTEMYFQASMSDYYKTNKLDTVLSLMDENCNPYEWFCNDDSPIVGGLSSYIETILKPGTYKVAASGYDNATYGSYVIDYILEPYRIDKFGPYGTCFNPVVDEHFRVENLRDFNYTHQFPVQNETLVFNCSQRADYSSQYLAISLVVPQGKLFNGTISLMGADGKNKMDTFIEIRDKFCRKIDHDGLCDDDSPRVGGLSSQIGGMLPSGEYRLIIGVLGEYSFKNFTIKVKSNLV